MVDVVYVDHWYVPYPIGGRVPVFLSFMAVNVVIIYIIWGGAGMAQFVHSIFSSISTFVLLPIPLFIVLEKSLSIRRYLSMPSIPWIYGWGASVADCV